ncbi:hypothetical protein WJX81_005951 [Elliptochloris bilobata]|uniref:FPL domain-containing protein n=1 Tax=Elliptochloris bilobata TaxID=381761 RepID=A0AAW1QVA0_9CHLO
MAKRGHGFWGALLGPPPPPVERFSLESLRGLHDVLQRNANVTDANRETVVEALRSIAELMIWGDQHDARFFDYFAENNLLAHFTAFLVQRSNRQGDVAKQVLQTLSILIQNIRSTTAIFYLFSNNHVNEIIALRFDFEDDEVLGYYINLLKTVSLKLNSSTVQFFYQDNGEHAAFPLYTEAVKFINHRDGMVRAAVRTLTLNVYQIGDPAVQAFVVSQPASNYFTELAIFIAEQCQALDRQLSSLEAGTSAAAFSLESLLAEVEDLLSYCNDILGTGEPHLAELLLQRLLDLFAGPVLLWPLVAPWPAEAADAAARLSADPPPVRLPGAGERGHVRPLCALYVLERLLHVVTHPRLVSFLAAAMLLGAPLPERRAATQVPAANRGRIDAAESAPRPSSALETAAGLGRFRQAFMRHIGGRHASLAAAAARVLAGFLLNRAADADLLDAAGLLPHRRKKNRELMEALTGPGSPRSPRAHHAATGSLGSRDSLFADEGLLGLPAQPRPGRCTRSAGTSPHASLERVRTTEGASGNGRLLASLERCELHPIPDSPPSPPDSSSAARASDGGSGDADWADALCMLLLLQALPSTALWGVGWILLQLFGGGKAGAELSALQREVLGAAAGRSRAELAAELGGAWGDALPLLAAGEWRAGRAALLTPAPQSTATAVQAWMQAVQLQKAVAGGWGAAARADAAGTQTDQSSSAAALRAHYAVQRFVALTQLRQGLVGGDVADAPPTPLAGVSEAALRARELREGAELDPGPRLPCTVSFSRGQERSVALSVAGMPPSDLGSDAALDALAAAPAVVLVEAAEGIGIDLGGGSALSVAPLLGAAAAVDAAHPRWLHVHVRPPARGLVKTVRAASAAGAGMVAAQLQRQLVDGHWVLSFPDAAAAQAAAVLVQDHAARFQRQLAAALAPLLQG